MPLNTSKRPISGPLVTCSYQDNGAKITVSWHSLKEAERILPKNVTAQIHIDLKQFKEILSAAASATKHFEEMSKRGLLSAKEKEVLKKMGRSLRPFQKGAFQ